MRSNLISESIISNHLELFDKEGDLNVEATRQFMDLSLSELADAFGLTKEQVRPDRISDFVKEKIKRLAGALEFVAETFDGNIQKTRFWFKTPNPHFGGATPRELVLRGRHQKVVQFVLAARNLQK